MTLENYLAERQECVTSMTATSSFHVQVPDVESLSPKMTYAEVVRLPVHSSDTGNRAFGKVPITEEPVEELRSSYDENDKHIAYGSRIMKWSVLFHQEHIPSRTEFAESDEVEYSFPTTIEFGESDELECSISTIKFAESDELECSIPTTIEFAESDEVECSIPTTIDFAESEEVESSSPTRIEFALITVKVMANRCWKKFKRFILHLCGDVEENPGPTMEQFTFQSIEEWGRALPSGQF
ncbi:unnamed protein product [Mytilus coruscus]|uniref:Uncharacterized protein n=1 Tax=Mytilus coruscus TaxID=42192 RepID=A0A6J8EZ50_MYTCO|nr:unnamed protein product [Mytilus coruscus]